MEISKYDAIRDAELFFIESQKLSRNRFEEYTPAYLFSPEVPMTKLENVGKNGRLLLSTRYLDVALNSVLMNQKDIFMFDKNKVQKYFAQLKLEAIKKLDYSDFLELYNLSVDAKGKIVYDRTERNINPRILNYLCYDMQQSFSDFFERLLDLGCFEIGGNNGYYFYNVNPSINDYIKEDNFYKLKEILLSLSFNYFDDCASFDLKKHIGDKLFSVILLSDNLGVLNEEELTFQTLLIKELKDNITETGIIQTGWISSNQSEEIYKTFVDSFDDKILKVTSDKKEFIYCRK